jgi:hypothetical protein
VSKTSNSITKMLSVEPNEFAIAGHVAPDLFWTSGSDVDNEEIFTYCTTNRNVRYEAK